MKKKKLVLDRDTLRALDRGVLRDVAGGIAVPKQPKKEPEPQTPACPTMTCPTEACGTASCDGDTVFDCTYLCGMTVSECPV